MPKQSERIPLPIADFYAPSELPVPREQLAELYILLDGEEHASADAWQSAAYHAIKAGRIAEGAPFRLAHVMSSAARGEIRAYVVSRGRAYLRSPCYAGAWSQMDLAVEAALTCSVVRYAIGSGGSVICPLPGVTLTDEERAGGEGGWDQ